MEERQNIGGKRTDPLRSGQVKKALTLSRKEIGNNKQETVTEGRRSRFFDREDGRNGQRSRCLLMPVLGWRFSQAEAIDI